MSLDGPAADPVRVPDWPRISAAVNADGTGTLTTNGIGRACAAESIGALRTGMIARAVTVAVRLNRPVRLDVTEDAQTHALAVRPEGYVQLIAPNGTIPPADGLAPDEGRCRICRRLQPVTSTTCPQCGVNDPLRVETTPAEPDVYARSYLDDLPAPILEEPAPDAAEPGATDGGRDDTTAEVDDAIALGATEPETDNDASMTGRRVRATFQEAGSTPALTLAVVGQESITVEAGISVGRRPDPIGGRLSVPLPAPGGMLSRTHATIDVDDAGQIILTDLHSTNGTDLLTDPPQHLAGGEPTVIPNGATVQLGDVQLVVTVGVSPTIP